MLLQLDHNIATHVSLQGESSEELDESGYSLQFTPAYNTDRDTEFAVMFKLSLRVTADKFLAVEYFSLFKTDEGISEDFKTSHFPSVNAPAIAFPFLRAYVAQVILISGYKPVILPSINFAAHFEAAQKLLECNQD